MKGKKLEKTVLDIQTGKKIGKTEKKEVESKMIISNAVFNVGITIQHNGVILETMQCGIDEFWNYPEHRIMDFYRKNFAKDGSEFTEMYDTFGEFINERFFPLVQEYMAKANVTLWSYNADFDRRAFVDTAKLENVYIPQPLLNSWKCIMVLACNTLLRDNGKKYFDWIIEQEYNLLSRPKSFQGHFMSFGRNARIKAETMYRYISGDAEFIEAHKGMQDTQIEGEILEWCKKKKGWKDLDCTPTSGGWTILNSLALPFQKKGTFDDEYNVNLLKVLNQDKLDAILDKRGD